MWAVLIAMAASGASAGGPGGGPVATRLRLTPLQFFTKFFEQFGLPVPLIGESWDSDGQCYTLQINGEYMEKPSLTSRRVAAVRQCSVPGNEFLPEARPLPDTFYHGTSVEGLQGILFRGRFATSAELGRRQHRPDGVYAYTSFQVSDQSMYVEQGCQVAFKAVAYGTSLNASRAAASVPEGVAMVMARSAHRRHGCEGFEWVLHPRSCELVHVRVSLSQWLAFLEREERAAIGPSEVADSDEERSDSDMPNLLTAARAAFQSLLERCRR